MENNLEYIVDPIRYYISQEEHSKAAMLFICLGSELSLEIYKYINDSELEILTFEIARIEKISFAKRISVLKEFYEEVNDNRALFGGIDYARFLLEESVGASKAIDIINNLTASLVVRPFDFIRRVNPDHILDTIKHEHPQIIALVLSFIKPCNAAIILESFEKELQSDIIQRISNFKDTSPVVLREIERVMEKYLSSKTVEDLYKAGGIETVNEILNNIKPEARDLILEAVKKEDSALVQRIKQGE